LSPRLAQAGVNPKHLKNFQIPLPPLAVQKEIVQELDGYQKIIDGCRQVVENYKPMIEIDPSWEMVELGELCEVKSGYSFKSELFNKSKGKPLIRIRDIKPNKTTTKYAGEYDDKFLIENGAILIGMDGEFNICIWKGEKALLNQRVCNIIPNKKVLKTFVFRMINEPLKKIEKNTDAITVKHISVKQIKKIKIPLPPLAVQKEIVKEIEQEQEAIDRCKWLIETYTKKIQDRIDKVWGAD